MQPANALLPSGGFASDKLSTPRDAIGAFFARVALEPPAIERVPLDRAFRRVLALAIDAADDYPSVPRSAMDGFALAASATPGDLSIVGEVHMGALPEMPIAEAQAVRIPTGGVLPPGADAVVPLENARVEGSLLHVGDAIERGANTIARAADMHRGETVLEPGRWIGAAAAAVLATLGVVDVPVFRRPTVAVLSSGDELVAPWAEPNAAQVRDSNRYAIAASLRAMGATPRHYPTIGDAPGECERALAEALAECDAVAITGGSSVGERDRIPVAVAALGEPGIIVHGLRIKPGKPLLLAAAAEKPILGLPGNPASALMVLEAVVAPIVAGLVGAPVPAATTTARLAQPVRGRSGWVWYVPVTLRQDGEAVTAHPLPLRSFSVSLTARADGYLIVDRGEEEWPAGALVAVHQFRS